MLRYESTSKVSASTALKIRDELESLTRAWWRGAIGFDLEDPAGPVTLSGSTPLFHPQGIADEDDLFMAFSDAAFIIERLAGWSKRFKIKWHVRMHDDDWGAVDASGLSRPLMNQMEKWARRAKGVSQGNGRWSVPEDRRAALLDRHKGRRS
jgi:hypothetical protein